MSIIYLQIYFVTIACILGTGILGLPVTLYKSGFYPFLISFLTTFFFQVLLIFITVEILQRACINQFLAFKESLDKELHDALQNKKEESESSEDEDNLHNHFITPPNLHMLSEMFLCNGVRHIFDFLAVLQLSSVLIGYCLAGSESYSEILHIEKVYIMPVYVCVLSSFIIFALHLIKPIVSFLTLLKGLAFALTVIITCIIGFKIRENVIDDYHNIGNSFLMGTVALGGTIYVMPFLYKDIVQNKTEIRKYLLAVLSALTTCTILNILWCWSVLSIVPQLDFCSNSAVIPHFVGNNTLTTPDYCESYISLEKAASNGEISTTPLVKLIKQRYQEYAWISTLIEIFIVISISVAFLTLGTALQDIVSGIIHSTFFQQRNNNCLPVQWQTEMREKIIKNISTGILFGIIFLIAIFSLKSFITVMEKVSSFALNTINILLFFMYTQSRRGKNSNVEIPLPNSKWMNLINYLLPVYFGFAVIYDGLVTITDYLESSKHNKTLFRFQI
ncbi:uncharacterized protein LOC115215027 isoform X2 [Octopus sinensis]|uniref:Uncharacterized protein LOC115215027 isoform X2 n=1 Tax=Octopus sinensis TaxID=2607531 RepID=A0A7E6ETP7_9MOLL|nr:uncharacterized protein LOC115215027 isoform X2 [Octopus sinensis]